MAKNNPLLDTNLIIRFLTGDDRLQADKVEKLLMSKEISTLEIPDLVFAEIIYVLLSVYGLSKRDVAEKMCLLTEFKKIKCNKKTLKTALEIFKDNLISFIDAYLLALAKGGKNPYIYSFDKRLLKVEKGLVRTP